MAQTESRKTASALEVGVLLERLMLSSQPLLDEVRLPKRAATCSCRQRVVRELVRIDEELEADELQRRIVETQLGEQLTCPEHFHRILGEASQEGIAGVGPHWRDLFELLGLNDEEDRSTFPRSHGS